jgi:uncharacterized membrane protein
MRRTDKQRAAGRKRAEQFTPEYQIEAGRRRAQQESFVEHNRQIAPDGFRAQSAYMRAPSGLRLLSPEHVQFLLPEQLYGPNGVPLTYEQQRIFFGLYVWKATWINLAPQPQMPSDEGFLAEVGRVQAQLHCGMPLEHPLQVIYAAANDFCDEAGEPWTPRKQRRLFRQALRKGRDSAEALVLEWQQQAQAERASRPHQPGQRRPSAQTGPAFQRRGPLPQQHQYGRPDLPSYHPYNLSPQRPYGVPATNDTHPIYWLPTPDSDEEEDN